ncbi:SURF1 family protein [Pilimelia columellifera]
MALVGLMALAGQWQHDRYQARTATNAKISAARTAPATPIEATVPGPPARPRPGDGPVGAAGDGPTGAGAVGPAPDADRLWSPVSVTGRYRADADILVRGRRSEGRLGFEVLTPLTLADGTAILVDRGWVQVTAGDARSRPAVPRAPAGPVTVVGRLAPGERGAQPIDIFEGRIEVRQVTLAPLAERLGLPLYGVYLLADQDQPGAASLVAVPSPEQSTWQNLGYVIQWWIFAAMTVFGFGWLARREARGPVARAVQPVDRAA